MKSFWRPSQNQILYDYYLDKLNQFETMCSGIEKHIKEYRSAMMTSVRKAERHNVSADVIKELNCAMYRQKGKRCMLLRNATTWVRGPRAPIYKVKLSV